MDRDKAIQILNRASSSKDSLRQALSFALDVALVGKAKPKSVFTECKEIFLEAYRKHTNAGYYFAAKDAGSLKQVIVKIEHLNNSDEPDLTKATFEALMSNLPEWYRAHGFSISVINSKFNDIIAQIKNDSKKGNNSVSDSYKAKVLSDLCAE